jgi:hypothetical protein
MMVTVKRGTYHKKNHSWCCLKNLRPQKPKEVTDTSNQEHDIPPFVQTQSQPTVNENENEIPPFAGNEKDYTDADFADDEEDEGESNYPSMEHDIIEHEKSVEVG